MFPPPHSDSLTAKPWHECICEFTYPYVCDRCIEVKLDRAEAEAELERFGP